MNKRTKYILSLVILGTILALTGTIARAAMTSGSFLIRSNTLSGAQAPGGRSTSSSYIMTGAWGGMIGVSSSSSFHLNHGSIYGQHPDFIAQAPQITSPDSTTFAVSITTSFTVTTTGFPEPSLAVSGALPGGVAFTDNGDGTAILSGTPAAGSEGVYPLTITASNGVDPDDEQTFTITVVEAAAAQAPQITSPDSTTFAVGVPGSFTVTTTGIPTVSLAVSGALPGGVAFTNNGDGTATLSGTPSAGSEGEYSLTITASNGVPPNATQLFTLWVDAGSTVFLPLILR
jgi:large repetitive protein